MAVHKHEDLRRLFDLAIEAPAEQRQALLDRECRGDAELRKRIEAMIAAAEDDRFLAAPTGDVFAASADAALTVAAPLREGPGTRIGPYKILQLIGEGGFGSVFMAEQEKPVQRKVALKIIKLGMDTRQVIARFEAERQALAMMDHPNIARVLDAGATETGRPYFVMDLVKGDPIAEYCDKNNLSIDERLELFAQVCHAVQHAHTKGIIHRDIKPSNILVSTHDGRPNAKVIDFGIAKATASKLTEKTLFTEHRQLVGTPEYMSPEQAEGSLDIDTRTDVYSLGVLLYELLTGSTPFDSKQLRSAAFGEIQRIIREVEPPKPSTRISQATDTLASVAAHRHIEPKKLGSIVRGELDWIVMKALEKDRQRRYETANGLAMDIQRYRSDEAVEAHPPSAAYRMKKLLRKHKGLVIAASLVGLALIGGIIGTGWGLVRAEQARERETQRAEGERLAKEEAQAREAETKAVLDFVENKVFAAARPKDQEGGQGYEVKLADAIQAALPYVETSFTDQPLIEARLRSTLGRSFWYLGKADVAEQQYRRARDLFTAKLGPDHPDTIGSMHNLATSYADLGRHPEALTLREETLKLRKAKLGPDHPHTLASMNNLANSYYALGRHPEALTLREETLKLQKAKLGPDHPNTLGSMSNLAESYTALGRLPEALTLREETLKLRKAKFGPDHPETFQSMHNLAKSYADLGRHMEALALREETLKLQKAKLGPDHPDTHWSIANLAASYYTLGRHAEALTLREETLTRRKALLGPDHPDTLWAMWEVAASLVQLERGAEAIAMIDDCANVAAGKVVDLKLIPGLIDLRLRHFEKTEDAAGCQTTAEMWEKLGRTDGQSLYDAACWRAVTATVIRATPGAEANEQADLAMEWLQQAVAAGYKNTAHMKKDTDLDPLRERDDFKKLLAELEEKPATQLKKQP